MKREQEKFIQDLQLIYDELRKNQENLSGYMALAKGREHKEAKNLVERFLSEIGLRVTKESIVASLNRIINLREDSLEQVMKKEGFSKEQIITAKERAYIFVSSFYLERFEKFIVKIEEKSLLSPFYRTLISGVHSVGLVMTKWQNGWTSHIINGINRELFELFDGDEEKIFEMLREKRLLDLRGDKEADRCYSVLVSDGDSYKRLSYAEAFTKEIEELERALDILISSLSALDDDIFNQKREWIEYFEALKVAFLHTEPDELVEYWAEVDRKWMAIKTPLQVGHPLEYYEDHYRKAVALEWDLRVINPTLENELSIRENIQTLGARLAVDLGLEAEKIFVKNIDQIKKTQLYIGQPVLFYGAEFNGLFSAQVVPNDERVSNELGKKIFAYPDYIRQTQRAKPIMKLALESFGKEFILKRRELLNDAKRWNRLYEITTIGHEFGHILWIDSDTEVKMNKKGQFKNIEEFKATSGGLMAFFENEQEELKEELLEDIISRAVNLIAWQEVPEVLPYYCEGLIHLDILYSAKAISFDGVRVLINLDSYEDVKRLYHRAYESLAYHYVRKDDANSYLLRFITKSDGVYLPRKGVLQEFVKAYYSRYKEIGQEVALDFEV